MEPLGKKNMTRHELRDKVFGLVFRIEFYENEEIEDQEKLFEEFATEEGYSEEDLGYIISKFNAVRENLDKIDAAIDECAVGWTRNRMGKCELASLRLGIYEMLFDDDIPVGVAMDEAVEIAKTYGDNTSGAFVNAILTKVKEKNS